MPQYVGQIQDVVTPQVWTDHLQTHICTLSIPLQGQREGKKKQKKQGSRHLSLEISATPPLPIKRSCKRKLPRNVMTNLQQTRVFGSLQLIMQIRWGLFCLDFFAFFYWELEGKSSTSSRKSLNEQMKSGCRKTTASFRPLEDVRGPQRHS